LHRAYACSQNRWGAASPCLPWCGREDSNLHAFRHPALNRACLPDFTTAANSWCPVRDLHPHRLDVSEASCCWKNRTRYWMRDSELHGACVLMKHARRLRLPSRRMAGGPGRICTSKDPKGSTALEAAASAGCATEPEGPRINCRGPERPRDRRRRGGRGLAARGTGIPKLGTSVRNCT
jgi:hypothetical protein